MPACRRSRRRQRRIPAVRSRRTSSREEIKGIVDAYRDAIRCRYVVIVGNDDAIPFFRYPDEALLGQESGYVPPVESNSPSEASLRLDYVLSQDAYGVEDQHLAAHRTTSRCPDLAVGRLVETPAEIAGLIDAYVAPPSGVVVADVARSSPAMTSSPMRRRRPAASLQRGHRRDAATR